MSVKERIAAIRLAEKVERNWEYANGIGVSVKVGKGVESEEWVRKEWETIAVSRKR